MDPNIIREQIATLHPNWQVHSDAVGKGIFVDIRVAAVLTFAIEITERDGIGVGESTYHEQADAWMGYDEVVQELDEAITFIEQKVASTSDLTIERLLEEAKQRKIDEAKYGGVKSIQDQIDAVHPGWVNAVMLLNKMYFASVVVLGQRFDIKLDPRGSISVREYRKEDESNNSKLLADRDYDVKVETLNEALAYIETKLTSK